MKQPKHLNIIFFKIFISLPDFGHLIWKMKCGLAAFCVAETKAEGGNLS